MIKVNLRKLQLTRHIFNKEYKKNFQGRVVFLQYMDDYSSHLALRFIQGEVVLKGLCVACQPEKFLACQSKIYKKFYYNE